MEVFTRLSGQSVRDSQLANFIASYANPSLCAEHKGKVKALIIISVIQAIIGFLLGFSIGNKIGPGAQWLFGALIALIPLLFAWGFYKNKAATYRTYIILSLVQLPRAFKGFETAPTSTLIVIAINIAIIAYVVYVQAKLFPDFIFMSPRRVKGQYVFSS